MKYFNFVNLTCVLIIILQIGCSKSQSSNPPSPPSLKVTGQVLCYGANAGDAVVSPSTSGSNVLPVQVGGSSLCGSSPNTPCVSVTVCTPGTTNCMVIPNILVDTGSVGLRIFSQTLSQSFCNTLPPLKDSTGTPVAECAQFGSSNDWGGVVTAKVQLAGEPAISSLPIQIINSTYATMPSSCGSVDLNPAQAGINGILGVGLFKADCGSDCQSSSNLGIYFSCVGINCSPIRLAVNQQVSNPVSALLTDNNGVVLDLPAISSSGTMTVDGSLYLGIGTRNNNTPGNVTTFTASNLGNFGAITTTFSGANYSESFIDSGSNGLYFQGSAVTSILPPCPANEIAANFVCPSGVKSFTNTNTSSTGRSGQVAITIGNAQTLFNTPNTNVYNDLGGDLGSSFPNAFDYGLPFFLGRKVYVGIDASASSLGVGPYWAY
jgi:hypothetical protein